MARRVIAIMQPTYLPWCGYFDLIDRVDCFVFLDSVQFSKRSWQQRNRIKGNGEALWLTVPVLTKGRSEQRIAEVEIDQTAAFQQKHLNTIAHLYNNAPYFKQHFADLTALLHEGHLRLRDLNVQLIHWLCSSMGIQTEIVMSSSLNITGRKTELLVDICKALDADRYLSVEGSRGYIEENNLFGPNNIELEYHDFHHPEYRQLHGDFIPYLSALDLLLNEGPSSSSIIRTGGGRFAT